MTSYDPSVCRILQRRVTQIYMMCCEGIKYMPTMQAKSFNAKLAAKINALLQVIHVQQTPAMTLPQMPSTKTAIETKDFQTQTIQAAPEIKIVKFHSPSIQLHTPRSRSDRGAPEGDQLLQQAIQKYQGLIESLYNQIEELQSDYEIKLATSQKECEKIQESQKNIREIRGKCNCPVQELQGEVKRLEAELRKRDKAKIKKIQRNRN